MHTHIPSVHFYLFLLHILSQSKCHIVSLVNLFVFGCTFKTTLLHVNWVWGRFVVHYKFNFNGQHHFITQLWFHNVLYFKVEKLTASNLHPNEIWPFDLKLLNSKSDFQTKIKHIHSHFLFLALQLVINHFF